MAKNNIRVKQNIEQENNFTLQLDKEKLEAEQKSYDEAFKIFAKSLASTLNNPAFYNPLYQNEILKDINMHPASYNRDKVEQLLANPRASEKQLRDLGQYLENFIMQFKQLVNYYSTILTFDYTLEPTNADLEDMKTSKFKASYKKANEWLNKFNIKSEFYKVMKGVLLEDAKFYYVRESENAIRLQEMASDYCKISRLTEDSYQYSFNMTYFQRPGINFDDYAPEFKRYYNNFMVAKQKEGMYFYWQELEPKKAPLFKFDINKAGLTPPLIGLMLDAVEIATFKNLERAKLKLESWKLLLGKIPLQKDNKSGNAKDDFAITANSASYFAQMISNKAPEGVSVGITPFEEVQAIDFANSQNKNNIIGRGNQNFWESSGVTSVIFGGTKLNSSAIQASIKSDVNFVKHMYLQFENFVNRQLRDVTGRYRFKIRFEGNVYDAQERQDSALKLAQAGIVVMPKIAAANGMTPSELDNLVNLSQAMGYPEKLIPLMTSYTNNGKSSDEGGRPQKSDKDLGDAGQTTRDAGSNIDKNK